ncbi:MAG: methyltransferase domain-containing protein [Cytophagales bacterium]|nr:methyltransferase domain-containing protein [Cytophagales bacterium]
MNNQITRDQFNKQAERYANWSMVTSDQKLKTYFNYCKIKPHDTLLDVACGPGDFAIYSATMIAQSAGVDISDNEIEIGRSISEKMGLKNVSFDRADVENLPHADHSFSVVTCRYAFHHFINAEVVFKEMIRCCQPQGKIGIVDITSYEDPEVNQFFERFDKLVDVSHNKTRDKHFFNQLFIDHKVQKTNEIMMNVDLNVQEYIDHAVQSEENKLEIQDLLSAGLKNEKLKNFLFMKQGELHYRRHVYLTRGTR